jgi:predicted negative regulator of RcsB-dependent stress response
VDDLLSENEQLEWLKAKVREYWLVLTVGLAAGAIIVFGMRWHEARTERLALEAGAKYLAVLEALDRAEINVATDRLAELKKDYPSSAYVGPAQLAMARVFVATNEMDKAADQLRSVMTDAQDEQLRLVARLRLARVQIGQGKTDDALKTLETLPAGSAFTARFAEARGDALLVKGDRAAALKEFLAARGAEPAMANGNGGVAAASQLELKINDLKAGS